MARVMLQGPYNTSSTTIPLMNDNLRTLNLIPSNDPYSASPFNSVLVHVNGDGVKTINPGILDVLGSNAIVDWVFLELRNKTTNTQVMATRSALLQSDGDIVDMDGSSPVRFVANLDKYYIVVRHRNHLGVMTSTAIDYAASMSPGLIDFVNPSTSVYNNPIYLNTSRKLLTTGVMGLWAGDATFNGQVKYNGSGNDSNAILNKVGTSTPLNTVSCYCPEDINMNGLVKYNGSGNDRLIILNNVGASTPLNVIVQQIP
jgi:hypothetical protein